MTVQPGFIGCPGDALARATETAAIAAMAQVGRGDEKAADLAAARAMRAALANLPLHSRIVVGESEILDEDYEPVLAAGQVYGAENGPEFDVALDALEGATIAAKAKANALTVIAAGPRGSFLPVPDIYMDKLAIGPGYPQDLVDLDAPAGENAIRLAKHKGVDVTEITACVLDRPRHEAIITDLRLAGARVNLIGDGDVAAVIHTAMRNCEIDMYVGQGGAPMGVLAAAALKCVGGQFQGRLVFRAPHDKAKAERAGLETNGRRYSVDDLVSEDCVFAATGVTRGLLLDSVRVSNNVVRTHSLVMASETGLTRWIRSERPFEEATSGRDG